MMFMIPMPPTSSETLAMQASSSVSNVRHVTNCEIVRIVCRKLVTLPQQFSDLLLRGVGCILRNCRDVGYLQTRAAEDLFLHRCVWSKSDIVLIATLLILSFSRHHSGDSERQVGDTQCLADGIHARKQIVGDGLTDHDDARSGAHISVGKELTTLHRPLAHIRILFTHALDGGVPVRVSGHELRSSVYRRRNHGNAGHLSLDCIEVFYC